jgi:hypothetical protein
MTILLGIIKLLGSAGFGTIFGGLMGLLHRRQDLDLKKIELQDAQNQRAHELAMRDKDAAIMAQEWAGRTRVAEVETAGAAEVEAFKALSESYKFAQPERGSKMAAFSSFIRPFISLGYFLLTSFGGAWILWYAFTVRGLVLTNEQLFEIVMYVIAWVAFMGGATIGWWYAMRPGTKMPMLNIGAR